MSEFKPPTDAPQRFSNRVEDYVRYRPGYPKAVLECLSKEFGFTPQHIVADVGAGTGILTRMLLDNGNRVFAVEPNDAMRVAAEAQLREIPGFESVPGTAENTTLPYGSVDWVLAAQAFHWFDVNCCREEFRRILRTGGHVAILWNDRTNESEFLQAYEQLLQEHGTDFGIVRHEAAETDGRLDRLFGVGHYVRRDFPNEQILDEAGLIGRTVSASYMPSVDHPGYEAVREALSALFRRHEVNGCVSMLYETHVYVGKPRVD